MNTDDVVGALCAAIFVAALAIACVFLHGCVPKPPPPTPPVPPGIPYCSPAPELDPDRICRGLFTRSGAPCVSCGGAAGCYDRQTGIYCVLGPCFDDGECEPERPDVLGAR